MSENADLSRHSEPTNAQQGDTERGLSLSPYHLVTLSPLDCLELKHTQLFRLCARAQLQDLNPDDVTFGVKIQNHAGLNLFRLDNL